jgi:FkbM family methyltransferase
MTLINRLRSLFKTQFSPSVVEVLSEDTLITLHNRPFYIDELDSLDLRSNPIFEPEETRLCNALISSGDTCLDIGANIGYYSVLFAKLVGPSGKVIAAEPDPDNFKLLKKNSSLCENANTISLHQTAFGNEEKVTALFKSKDNHGMHRLYSSICCSEESSSVSVVLGDSLNIVDIDFLKIDIEGYELPALSGLKKTIENSPKIKILTEYSPLSISEAGFSPRAMIELMLSFGLTPLENLNGIWGEVSPDNLLLAADLAEKVDMPSFTKSMKNQTNQEITDSASAALLKVNYPRPLLENLVWLPPQDVAATIDRVSNYQ